MQLQLAAALPLTVGSGLRRPLGGMLSRKYGVTLDPLDEEGAGDALLASGADDEGAAPPPPRSRYFPLLSADALSCSG